MAFATQTSTLAPNHRLEASLNILSVNPNGSFTFEFVLAIRRDGGTGVNGSFNLSLHEGIRPTGGDSGSTTLFNYDLRTASYQELARSILTRTPSGPQTSIFYAITNQAGGSNTFGPVDLTVTADIPAASPASFPSFSPASFVAGTPISISWTAAQSTYRHTLRYSFGPDVNFEIESGIVGSQPGYSYTPPAYLLSYIPDAPSAPYTISLETFTAGGTSLGVRSVTGELRAPSTGPTVTAVSVSDTNAAVASQVGAFVQGLSVLRLDGITATATNGATIAERRLEIGGQNLRIGETRALIASGTQAYTARAWDSRGREGSLAGSISVLPYSGPILGLPLPSPTGSNVFRSTSSGVYDPKGAYLTLSSVSSVASLVNGTQRNSIQLRVYTRPFDSDTWTLRNTINPSTTVVSGRLRTPQRTDVITGGAIYSPDESYVVRIEVIDEFNTTAVEDTISTSYVAVDLNGGSVGIGKLHERGTLDVANDAYFEGLFYSDWVTDDLNTAVYGGWYSFSGGTAANTPAGIQDEQYRLKVTRTPSAGFPGVDGVVQEIVPYATPGRVAWFREGVATLGDPSVGWEVAGWIYVGETNSLSGTSAQRALLPPEHTYPGLKFYDTDTGLEWYNNGTAWKLTPGQVLASMVGPAANTTGAIGTIVGTVISTPVLPVGQQVKIVSNFSQYRAVPGSSYISTDWRNNASDVTSSARDGQVASRVHSDSNAQVVSGRGCNILWTTTTAAKVSAALYIRDANSGVYGVDGTHLYIESA